MVRQLARYGIVGLVSNSAGYLLYLLVTYAGADPKQTVTIFYATGAAIGFFGNRKWAFSHRGSVSAGAIRYAIAHTFGYLINISMLMVFSDRMGYPHQLIQALAVFFVGAFLFLAFKYFVFPKGGSKSVTP